MAGTWPTKLRTGDLAILARLREAPSLSTLVPRVWRRTVRRRTRVASVPPANEPAGAWKSTLCAGQGMTLGGRDALSDVGMPVFRGQNIFPTGLKGQPVGFWDGDPDTPKLARLHLYQPLFDYERLFAGRKICQLPTVCRAPPGTAYQDTAIVIQLAMDLPLDAWVLARPIQWFAAKVARSGIVEDLGASWHKRQYLSLPAPAADADLTEFAAQGAVLLEADRNLADGERRIAAALFATASAPLATLAANGDPRTAGLGIGPLAHGAVSLDGVREEGTRIVGDDPGLALDVPDEGLRMYLLYALGIVTGDGAERFTLDDLQGLSIPRDTASVLEAVHQSGDQQRKQDFEKAHAEIDKLAAGLLGLTDEQGDLISDAMRSDPFLSKLRPSYEYRGARAQVYSGVLENRYGI